MNDFMLNLRDSSRAIHGTIDDLRLDYVVASLSADPETIAELREALARFLPDPAERASSNVRLGSPRIRPRIALAATAPMKSWSTTTSFACSCAAAGIA